MSIRKGFSVILVLAIMATALFGCSSTSPAQASAGAASSASPASTGDTAKNPVSGKSSVVIGMCNANLTEPWNAQMDADVASAAKAYPNVTVKYKDAAGDSLTQRSQVEEFINEGVDVLIISPVEATPMTEIITKAYKAKIPVFLVGRLIDNDSYTQYIGTDDFSLGYAAGQYLVDCFKDKKANVVELEGLMTSSPGYDRHLGFTRAIEKHSNIKVVYASDCKWLEDMGRSEMESVLSVHNDIDAVFGGNDPTAHGAYLAASAAGRAKNMIFFGIDGLAAEGRAYVRDGVFKMTICDATGGDIAVNNAMKFLKGEKVDKVYLKQAIIYEKDTLGTGGTVVKIPDDVNRTGQQTPIIKTK